MTRDDVIKLFPEATDEQVTKLLNQNNSEVATERDKSKKQKEELEKMQELTGQLEALQKEKEELEQGKLTETEKLAKELEKSNARVAELEKAATIQNQRASAAEKFKVTAEQAKQIVKDDGTIDYDVLGQIISEKETNAVSEYEKQKLAETQNPSGNSGGSDGNSVAKNIAVASAKRAGTANESILNNYRR